MISSHPHNCGDAELGPVSNKDEECCSTLASSVMRGEGRLSVNTKKKTHPASCPCLALGWGDGRRGEKGNTVSPLISASVPCVCQSNILKQHQQGSATANYPALGMGNEKTSWRTMKRTWLNERASVSADRLLFLMNIQHLNGPSRGPPLNIAPLFTALIPYVTTKYPPMQWLLDTWKGKRYIGTMLNTISNSDRKWQKTIEPLTKKSYF